MFSKSIKKLLSNILLLGFYVGLAQSSKKPNILFIMSDDHTSTAIGAYGGRLAKLNPTPTIDQLANEGMLLENTFCNNAICSPSRASILTGQYSSTNGVTGLGGRLPKEKQYLPIELKKAGYETAVIGKWHLGTMPLAFDYYKVMRSQGHYFNPIFTEKGQTIKEYKVGKKTEKGTIQNIGHSSDVIASSGIDWLQKRNASKPFFLKLHFKAPHGPFSNAPRYDTYLEDVKIPEPDNYRDRKNNGSIATRGYNDELINFIGTSVDGRNKLRNNTTLIDRKLRRSLSDKELTTKAYQVYLKKYLRCVKGVDDNVKLVIDHLKSEGLYDNTIIIYTGDQGFYLGEHNFIDKRWGYEEGMRMPFIIRYPKTIKAGTRSDAITENVDFAPTILDFAGAEIPNQMQGKSFKHILETGKEPKDWKQEAYYHYQLHMAHHLNPAHIGIRTKDYKLLLFYGAKIKSTMPTTPPSWELYDLKKDPTEDNNVYSNPKYTKTIKDLKEKLKQLRKDYKLDGTDFAYNKVINEYWDYSNDDYKKAIQISSEAKKSIPLYRKIKKNKKKH